MKERLREKLNERLELARRIQSGDYSVHQQAAQKAKNWPLYMGATTGVLFLIAFVTKSELATILAFVIGAATFVMVSTVGKLKLAGQAPILKEILGGTIIKPATEPTEGEGIPVGMLKMPERCETLHTLIEGGTGAGKTQVLKQMVAAIRERGDALVVIDTGYDMHKTFGQPGDIVGRLFLEPRVVRLVLVVGGAGAQKVLPDHHAQLVAGVVEGVVLIDAPAPDPEHVHVRPSRLDNAVSVSLRRDA